MPPPLRLQHQRESGVARYVDAGDVVHLDRDGEAAHVRSGSALRVRALVPRGKRERIATGAGRVAHATELALRSGVA